VSLALDVASTHFYRNGAYVLKTEQGRLLTSAEMVDRLAGWVEEFPIDCIEDGLAEEDWQGWQLLTKKLGDKVKLVGDDLFATNPRRLEKGISQKAANAVLIKVNQIGTLSETFDTVLMAKNYGYATIISARSGETEDDFLADLAVGVGGDYIKIGSITRSERLAKYNRLLRIWEELST
jgi:enolase